MTQEAVGKDSYKKKTIFNLMLLFLINISFWETNNLFIRKPIFQISDL
jgi:hypothetical protein